MIKILIINKQNKTYLCARLILAIALAFLLMLPNLTTVHAISMAADEWVRILGPQIPVSPEYDDLELQLRLFTAKEMNANLDSSDQKQTIVERQIVLLNKEIEGLNDRITAYVENKDDVETKMEIKQIRLESKHERNVQKIKTIGEGLIDICFSVDIKDDGIGSLINQISALGQIVADDKGTISEISQMNIDRKLAKNEMEYCEDRLSTMDKLLTGKRQAIYQLLSTQKDELDDVNIGELIDKTDEAMITTHIDQDGMVWADPCVYKRISSPFGYRMHPIYNEWTMHNGVDLTNKSRTPLYATRSGVVIDSDYDSSSGYHVVIDHMDGYKSYYLHLHIPSELKVGDVVVIGDYIGQMGSTGVSTGPHLHFGISANDEWVDPMIFIGD